MIPEICVALPDLAGTFATIVGLIGQFKQESQGQSLTFEAWLDQHRHTQIKEMLEKNSTLQTAIAKLLLQDSRRILAQIDGLSKVLLKVASGVEGFRSIASALSPEQQLYPEEMALLRELVTKDWRKFILQNMRGRIIPAKFLGRCEPLQFEAEFLEQDLAKLTALGFYDYHVTDRGTKSFTITRMALKLFEGTDMDGAA